MIIETCSPPTSVAGALSGVRLMGALGALALTLTLLTGLSPRAPRAPMSLTPLRTPADLAAAPTSATNPAQSPSHRVRGTWYFAVSGDSRDCGDLIMPKIAAAIASRAASAPADFYWHLGDFRKLTDIDCDIAKRADAAFECDNRPPGGPGAAELAAYRATAWQDFIDRQLAPFGSTPVFLALGNHELAPGRSRGDARQSFRRWLTQEAIRRQCEQDGGPADCAAGETYYHFVWRGIDFITLDNADAASFTAAQLTWLAAVLAADRANPAVTTIVAGMHEALPYSASRGHAMDASCQGQCSGQQAYDLLFRAAGRGGPPSRRKHVYLFASHAHTFLPNLYDQPEHSGQVLPAWLIGTAGAEQYSSLIRYGYLEVAVHPGGTLTPTFREVTRTSSPAAAPPSLVAYCFERNRRTPADSAFHGACACGAAAAVAAPAPASPQSP